MSNEFTYKSYVTDDHFTERYQDYQKRYATEPRESDKVIIAAVRELAAKNSTPARPLRLLDAGCSTGNLLSHLKRLQPEIELTGGDMVPTILDECRKNPALAGIAFTDLNLLDFRASTPYDFITVNAVLYMLDDAQLKQGLEQVFASLHPGGWLLAFDFFHRFNQDLAIHEKSRSHPDGLMLHFRPMSQTRPLLERIGFANVEFRPFCIPIDLQSGSTFTDNRDGFEDLNSYTVKDESGARMLFRGTLYQPWCHLLAQKPG
jgi:SAM-dependent methyltransferase